MAKAMGPAKLGKSAKVGNKDKFQKSVANGLRSAFQGMRKRRDC